MIEKIKNSQRLRSGLLLLLFAMFFIITIGTTVSSNNKKISNSGNNNIEVKDTYELLTNNNYHYTYSFSINNDIYQIDGYQYNDLTKETYRKNGISLNNINDIKPYYNFVKLTNIRKLTKDIYLKSQDENDDLIIKNYEISNKNINMILLSEDLNKIVVSLKENTSIQIDLDLDNYFSEIYNQNYKVKLTIIFDQFNLITENMMQ